MRGTARIRYFYWKQPVTNPTPTQPPPTATLAPLPALGTYHVDCAVFPHANARNFPARQTIPINQIDGQGIIRLLPGTVVDVLEWHPARDNIYWARITGWEQYNGIYTLWIRMKQPDNSTDILTAGLPSECALSTPDFQQTPSTPVPFSYPIASPGCNPTTNSCPHQSPQISNRDLLSFIMACEAGLDINNPSPMTVDDAIANGHVIHNRTQTITYQGSTLDVVRQSDQWSPYMVGCNPTLGLNLNQNNALLVPQTISQAAQDLLNGLEPQYPIIVHTSIDYLSLYTFGFPNPFHPTPPQTSQLQTVFAPWCMNNGSTAVNVYNANASFVFGGAARTNASFFFSDSPGCFLPAPTATPTP